MVHLAKSLENVDSIASRDATVDAMKGVAVLSVIAAHSGFPLLLWVNPSTFFLVAFFLISGFYLNTKQSALQFVNGKFLRLIVPYYIFFTIVAIVSYVWGRCTGAPLLPNDFLSFRNLVLEPFTFAHRFYLLTPLWFLTALFEGMLIVTFFRATLEKIGKSGKSSAVAIVIFLLLAQMSIELSALVHNLSPAAFAYRAVMIFSFICVGYLGWRHKAVCEHPVVRFCIVYLFLFLIWKFNPSYIISWNDYGGGIKRHLFVICNFLGCISLFVLCRFLQNCHVIYTFLQLCGRRSFSLMALHMTAFAVVILIEHLVLPSGLAVEIVNMRRFSAFQRFALFVSGIGISLLFDGLFRFSRGKIKDWVIK